MSNIICNDLWDDNKVKVKGHAVREQRITVYTWYFPYNSRGKIRLTLLRCIIRNPYNS